MPMADLPVLPIDEIDHRVLPAAARRRRARRAGRHHAHPRRRAHLDRRRAAARARARARTQTDIILLTHVTVEQRLRRGVKRIEALPTVLSRVMRIRLEDMNSLARRYGEVRQRGGMRAGSLVSPTSCWAGWRPTAGCRCRRVPAGRRGRARPRGARCRTPNSPSAAAAVLRRHPGGRPAARWCRRTYTAQVLVTAGRTRSRRWSRRCAARARPAAAASCPTGRRWRSRTWRCSCSASSSSTCWRASAAALNILGATSGDTGSAAEYAMRGRAGHPGVHAVARRSDERRSRRAQMYSLRDANIFNIAVDGVFDDCQDMVKSVSNDLRFKARYAIGTVNSINWARVVAQVVYYFKALLRRHPGRSDEPVSFAVPSRQLRQRAGRPHRADDGAADPAAGGGDQRERRARRVLPHRPLPPARPPPTR